MPDNRRTFKKFNIISVVEYKLLTENNDTYFGMMTNFSNGGFCLETQHSHLEPEDNLKLKFKHPESDLSVTCKGHVVWKEIIDNFKCLMGIQFEEMDIDNRINMLHIMSASGDIPIDTLLFDGDIEIGEELDKEPDMRMSGLSTGESNKIIPQHELDVVSQANTRLGKKKQYNKMLKYVLMVVIFSTALAFTIPVMKENFNKQNKDQLLIPSKSAASQNPGGNIPQSSDYNIQSARAPDQVIPLSVKPHMLKKTGVNIPDKKKVTDSNQSPPTKILLEYYIQVGSWINPDYAKGTLAQLNKYYPDATIVVHNNFNKIKIPGIKNRTHGNKIIKDIEDKFHLNPLLVLKR